MASYGEVSREFLSSHPTDGQILGGQVKPGDERGTRPGEGYPGKGKKPMKPVGEMRLHYKPPTSKAGAKL